MAAKPIPTPDELRQLLTYEPDTGKLFWKKRGPGRRSIAMNTEVYSGHLIGELEGKRIFAHRVAFAIYYGRWPENHIDHIDGNPKNNRITNLRECVHGENMCNRRSAKNSTSRFLGVSYERRRKTWRAEIKKHGKSTKLGTFICEIAAARAYDEAAKTLHGPFARLNFP